MRRFLKWASAVVGVVVLALFVLVLLWDWNWFRGRINEAGSSVAGREFAVEGDIDVDLSWKPLVRLHQVRVSNADWAAPENMVDIELVQFRIELWELLTGRIVLPELTFVTPRVELEKSPDGKANWKFPSASSAGVAVEATLPDDRTEFPLIGRLRIDDGILRYRDPVGQIDLEARISTAIGEGHHGDRITLEGDGTFAERPFRLRMIAGSLLALREADQPYPVAVEARIGETRLEAEGAAAEPIRMEGLDFRMLIEGDDMAEIFPIFQIPFPETPPYRLTGRLSQEGDRWRFADFDGRMGSSDLAGDLIYLGGGDRPMIEATFVSSRLAFADLAGLLGLEPGTGEEAERRRAEEEQRRGRVLPDAPVDLSRLRAADMDVRLEGRQIVYEGLPVQSLDARFLLQEGRLQIDPLTMGVAGGTVSGSVVLDGREEVPAVRVSLDLARLNLAPFFDDQGAADVAEGRFGGHVNLGGRGRSVAEILASGDGRAAVSMSGGRLSHLLVELAGLDIAESLPLLLGDDQSVAIHCVVGDFDIRNGIMTSRALVIDTTDTNLGGEAMINLEDESLNVRMLAEPKDFSPLAVRTPITVTGTLSDPQVGIDLSGVVARGAAAVAFGALVAPLAAIIPFIELGVGEDSDCAALIWQASGRAG